jgi:hypothetical protein
VFSVKKHPHQVLVSASARGIQIAVTSSRAICDEDLSARLGTRSRTFLLLPHDAILGAMLRGVVLVIAACLAAAPASAAPGGATGRMTGFMHPPSRLAP